MWCTLKVCGCVLLSAWLHVCEHVRRGGGCGCHGNEGCVWRRAASRRQPQKDLSFFFFLIPLPLFRYRKRSPDQTFDRASVPPAWRHSHQTQETHTLQGWQPSPAHALLRNTSCLRNWESKLELLHFFKPTWHVWAGPRCYSINKRMQWIFFFLQIS